MSLIRVLLVKTVSDADGGNGTHTKTSLFQSAMYGGPVVNELRGSRYHLPPVVI